MITQMHRLQIIIVHACVQIARSTYTGHTSRCCARTYYTVRLFAKPRLATAAVTRTHGYQLGTITRAYVPHHTCRNVVVTPRSTCAYSRVYCTDNKMHVRTTIRFIFVDGSSTCWCNNWQTCVTKSLLSPCTFCMNVCNRLYVAHGYRCMSTFVQEYVREWHQLPQPLAILHTLGDAGTLLLTYTCTDETFVRASIAYVRHVIEEWKLVGRKHVVWRTHGHSATRLCTRTQSVNLSTMHSAAYNAARTAHSNDTRRQQTSKPTHNQMSIVNARFHICSDTARVVRAPPHLYGVLAAHSTGRELLIEAGSVECVVCRRQHAGVVVNTMNTLRSCAADDARLTPAIWAAAHMAADCTMLQDELPGVFLCEYAHALSRCSSGHGGTVIENCRRMHVTECAR
jgi:hypothetical protein